MNTSDSFSKEISESRHLFIEVFEIFRSRCKSFLNHEVIGKHHFDLLISYPLSGAKKTDGEAALVNFPELGLLFLWGVTVAPSIAGSISSVAVDCSHRLKLEQRGWKDFSFSISDINPGLPFRWQWEGSAKVDSSTMQLFGIFVKQGHMQMNPEIRLTIKAAIKKVYCFGFIHKNIETVSEVNIKLNLSDRPNGVMRKPAGVKTLSPLVLVNDLGLDNGYYKEVRCNKQLLHVPSRILE